MKIIIFLIITVLFTGCAGGPTHTYYNPAIVGAKFKGPITILHVDDVPDEKEKRIADGYTFIGSTRYSGKHPEAVELKAQARRVNANHVIYNSKIIPGAPGSWSFSIGPFGGNGGSGGAPNDVYIVFMGK